MKSKYIAILLSICFVMLLVSIINFVPMYIMAVDNGITNIINIKPEISAPFINPSQVAIITYSDIGTNFDINDCSYETAGVDVISMTQHDDVLEFQVQPTINEGFGELKIHIEGESEVLEDTVYLYNTGEKTFFDKISKYQAWYSAMLDLYEQNTENNIVISEAEICDRYSAFTSPLLEGMSMVTNNDTNTVKFVGNVDWEIDDIPVYDKPTLDMRNALIEIGVKNVLGFNKIASGYTDENGNYEIVINSGDWVDNEDIYFRICLEGKTFEVSTFWFFPHYYYEYNLGEIATIGSTVNYNVKIKCEKNEDVYKATYIHQAMTIAERFAEQMGFQSNNFIRVAFPTESITIKIDNIDYSLSDMAFCYGDFWDNCICAIGINSWQRTETMVHEYSHYIQCSMGNYGEELLEILYENPNHDGISDYYAQKGDKSFAMHLSWTEGWGYVFSVMAQKYYEGEYDGLENYETDVSYDGDFIGEFQEKSIKAFLWSLLDQKQIDCKIDTTNAILDYQLPWTPQEWWNMTTVQGTYRLPNFIGLIENEGYNLGVDLDYKSIKEYIAGKLTQYSIAPQILYAEILGVNKSPKIKWVPNGSNTFKNGEYYSNNRFYVKVLDQDLNIIYTSELLSYNVPNLYTCEYTIPQTHWNSIIDGLDCEDKVYISIQGYRYDIDEDGVNDISGPYNSAYYLYAINSMHNCGFESIDGNTHKYYCNTCGIVERVYDHTFSGKNIAYAHESTCTMCGYKVTLPHEFSYMCKDDNSHDYWCIGCNLSSNQEHEKVCTAINHINHTNTCAKCEYSKIEPHNFDNIDCYIKTCIDCGYTMSEDHDFIYNEIDSGYHTTTCSKCDYTSTDEHDIYTFIEYTQHGDKCHDCGYVDESTLEDHVYSSWIYQNEFNHISTCGVCGAKGTTTGVHAFFTSGIYMICADCGYTKLPGIGGGNIIMSNTKVSLNGSYIMPDGTIMLVDEDIEAYLNGTLVFYNKDNLPVVQ